MAPFLDVPGTWISKVYRSALVIDRMDFEWSSSGEPLKTSISLGLFGFVLLVLYVHPFTELHVIFVEYPVLLVVFASVAFLKFRNIF